MIFSQKKDNILFFNSNNFLQVLLPRRSEGRIGDTEVVGFARMTVLADGAAKGDVLVFARVQLIGKLIDVARNHEVE